MGMVHPQSLPLLRCAYRSFCQYLQLERPQARRDFGWSGEALEVVLQWKLKGIQASEGNVNFRNVAPTIGLFSTAVSPTIDSIEERQQLGLVQYLEISFQVPFSSMVECLQQGSIPTLRSEDTFALFHSLRSLLHLM